MGVAGFKLSGWTVGSIRGLDFLELFFDNVGLLIFRLDYLLLYGRSMWYCSKNTVVIFKF